MSVFNLSPIEIILGICIIIGVLAIITLVVNPPTSLPEQPMEVYIDPGQLPNEDPKMWSGSHGNGRYCIMVPIQRDDESYAGAGGLCECTCFATREEAVKMYNNLKGV